MIDPNTKWLLPDGVDATIGDEIIVNKDNAQEFAHIIGQPLADLISSMPDDQPVGHYEIVSVSEDTMTLEDKDKV